MKKTHREGPNRDVSAGTSHSDPDGSASKPGTASSQAGATQGAAPITTCIEHAYGSAYRLSFQIKVY